MLHTCHHETQPAVSGPLLETAWYRVKYVQYSHLCEGFLHETQLRKTETVFFFIRTALNLFWNHWDSF